MFWLAIDASAPAGHDKMERLTSVGDQRIMRKNVKKIGLGGAAVLGLLLAVPASPAFAIDQVACGQRDDFVKLEIALGGGLGTNRCFANAGVTAVDIDGVHTITSGNNKVTINWEYGGLYYTETLDPGFRISTNGSGETARVYEVRIW
ncbi:beta/gamma crystallin domain-containing protein [Lentzea sp. NPDC004782]|uniref:beta/gamma crystallin domain-containing protein n=1 Tax=Lentzea sp. NPDC004782 TaxID=3154458 RepID=UPI0033B68A6A